MSTPSPAALPGLDDDERWVFAYLTAKRQGERARARPRRGAGG